MGERYHLTHFRDLKAGAAAQAQHAHQPRRPTPGLSCPPSLPMPASPRTPVYLCRGPHPRVLQEACSFFAGRAAAFANRRGWTLMAAVLKQFQTHILYGSKLEIVPLTELKGVDVATARLLHNAGRRGRGAAGMLGDCQGQWC